MRVRRSKYSLLLLLVISGRNSPAHTFFRSHWDVLNVLHRRQSSVRVGRFSEAGLYEWMPFVIFRAKKSREVPASLPGRLLSRRCFTLCITMEVEPRIAKQYKCHHCFSCRNYPGKGDGGWPTIRKCRRGPVNRFSRSQNLSRVRGKNAFWVIL